MQVEFSNNIHRMCKEFSYECKKSTGVFIFKSAQGMVLTFNAQYPCLPACLVELKGSLPHSYLLSFNLPMLHKTNNILQFTSLEGFLGFN